MNNYIIHVSRQEGRCIASIPELCITGEASNPERALANVLLAESEELEKLLSSGLPVPQSVDGIHSLPKVRESLMKVARFFGKATAAFIVFLILSTAAVVMIYPTFEERGKTYLLGPAFKMNIHKMLKLLGISVCVEDKIGIVDP